MTKIKLTSPLTRGDTTIRDVELSKPKTGEMRGLKLTDVLQMDVSALAKLLPRITTPALLPIDVDMLDPADLLALGGAIVGFFASEDQKVQMGL